MNNEAKIFEPLEWQVAPWRSKALILLMDGAAGGGKSHIAAEKMDALMRRYPGSMGLMLRKTRESLTNSTLLYFEREILGNDSSVILKKQDKRFEYANGSILAYGGMKDEMQRESIRSIGQKGGVDFIWLEEAHQFTLADFEELLPRLRGDAAGWRQIMLTTNPDSDQHWIYTQLIKTGRAARFTSSAYDNTYNPPEYTDIILDSLTGVRRLRLRDGLWIGAEGAVYGDFRYDLHVVEPFDIPQDWRRFRSIDFGYNNPFVCQWWAMDPDGRLYLYREIYRTGVIVSDHAEVINNLTGDERIEFSVADHDSEDRATLRRYGITTVAAKKAVLPGIEAVQLRLRTSGDGRPRLFFFNNALQLIDASLEQRKLPTCAVDEITVYVWPDGVDGKPHKEQPVKEYDHSMDAMRYLVMQVDGKKRAPSVASYNPFFN